MRLNQLKFLVELNKYKTISETAKKLYISHHIITPFVTVATKGVLIPSGGSGSGDSTAHSVQLMSD